MSSAAEDTGLPLDLPISDVAERAYRNIGICCASFIGCCAVAAGGAPQSFVFDLLGCVAAAYSLFLFCFQNCYYEWPALNFKVITLVVLGHAAVLAPAMLQSAGLWADSRVRLLLWTSDVAFMIWTWRFMVRGPIPEEIPAGSMKGQACIITGCNTGIGYHTAEVFAQAGAQVIFACRSENRAQDAISRMLAESKGTIDEKQLIFLKLDVSDFSSVRAFVKAFEDLNLPLHRLVLNAGVMLRSRSLSVDGVEMTMASNHFGHFLLVHLLLPQMLAAEKQGVVCRVVFVGSNIWYGPRCIDWSEAVVVQGHTEKEAFLKKPYKMFRAYGQSKLATVHFVTELDRRLRTAGSKIPVNAVHPGEVMTEVMRDMNKLLLRVYELAGCLLFAFLKSARQGALCTVHVATSSALATSDSVSGAYWVRLSPAPLSKAGQDRAAAERMWDVSLSITGTTSGV